MEKEAIGDCFESNSNYFINNWKPGWLLCHGVVENSDDHKPMVHCWIEYCVAVGERSSFDMVIDKSNGHDMEVPKAVYYRVGRVSEVVRYNHCEFMEKVEENDCWAGPWELSCER